MFEKVRAQITLTANTKKANDRERLLLKRSPSFSLEERVPADLLGALYYIEMRINVCGLFSAS